MSLDSLFAIDWATVPQKIVEALASGEARIINGVARDARTFEVLKHMPFRPVDLRDFNNLPEVARQVQNFSTLAQNSAAVMQMALTVSTAMTIGTVVLSTAYLASKLRDLETKIERLEGEVRGQSLIFYASKASAYFGAAEATRELIAGPELITENPDLVVGSISRLAGQRHETMAFIGNLFRMFEQLSPSHQALAIDFFHATLDFVPKAVFVETQAAFMLDRFRLGDHIQMSANSAYEACLQHYREWANTRLKRIVGGTGSVADRIVAERLQDARRIISSEENRLLLTCSI